MHVFLLDSYSHVIIYHCDDNCYFTLKFLSIPVINSGDWNSVLGPRHTIQVLRPRYWYQKYRASNFANLSCILVPDFVWHEKLGQNRTCAIASKFLVRDSGTISNLDGKRKSCSMDLSHVMENQ